MIEFVRTELAKIKDETSTKPIKTADARRIAGKLYRQLKGETMQYNFDVCEELLKERSWAMGVIAYNLAHRLSGRYEKKHFEIFEHWLETYVTGWGDCDDFCTHAFGELICQHTDLVEKIVDWTGRKEFLMRRASAVILLPSISKGLYNEIKPLQIADLLLHDEHDLVRKGYGWMLKNLSIPEPDLVYNYLLANKSDMPRTAYRYALKKMSDERKRILMQ